MNTIIYREDTPTQKTFKKAATEFLAAGSSVFAYHPFKTIGQQIFTGINLNLTPKALYRGFLGSALAAHQLFLMGTLEGFLKEIFQAENTTPFQKMGLGALAGTLTTFTVTPCEMMTIQKQNKKPIHFNTLFRGGVPIFFRQAGLGAGMLACPSLMQEKGRTLFPNEKMLKIGSCLIAGALSAAMTQVFDQARIMMQNDPHGSEYHNAKTALKRAPKEMLTSKGKCLFALRLATVAVATLVLSTAREAYPKIIFHKENKS